MTVIVNRNPDDSILFQKITREYFLILHFKKSHNLISTNTLHPYLNDLLESVQVKLSYV